MDPRAPLSDGTRRALQSGNAEIQRLVVEHFDLLVATREAAGEHLPEHARLVLNGMELAALGQHEISCLLADLVDAEVGLNQALYARLIILGVFEGSNALRGALGKRFREAFLQILPDDECDALIRDAHSQISATFQRAKREFKDVRDGVAGHRHPDPGTRVALLRKSDPDAVVDLAADYMSSLIPLTRAVIKWSEAVVARYGGRSNPSDEHI